MEGRGKQIRSAFFAKKGRLKIAAGKEHNNQISILIRRAKHACSNLTMAQNKPKKYGGPLGKRTGASEQMSVRES